jgi:hypothetical protein
MYPLPIWQYVEPHRGPGPISLLDIPLSVHFLDGYTVLVIYSTQAWYVQIRISTLGLSYSRLSDEHSLFCTTAPFDAVGHIRSAEGQSSM